MLAVDVDKGTPQLFEDTLRAQVTVHVYSVAARSGKHAPKNQLRLVLTNDFVEPQSLKEWMGVWEMEGGFELGLGFS